MEFEPGLHFQYKANRHRKKGDCLFKGITRTIRKKFDGKCRNFLFEPKKLG